MKNEKDEVISQTPAQANCYLARPEDFKVEQEREFGGQRGDSDRELKTLLAAADSKGKPRISDEGQDLPTAVDDATKPHTELWVSPGNKK
jgi:hypothetical protein